METDHARGRWTSKVGFVLAASGSAIGLGNIVFFSANAYKFGAGAFYLPYLVALFVIGIPVLVTELGLGGLTQKAFPQSLGRIAGPWGEFTGWWALINAFIISMYYVTILAWVCGMLLGSFGPLWSDVTATPAFAPESLANPTGFFFDMLSSWWVLALVGFAWLLNIFIVRRGISSIEPAVKVFVPLMWIFMIILIIRGVTLPNGEDGIFLLFTPDFTALADFNVWQGAIGQIFFSLTLGFGVMTAYASYLPKRSDHINYGIVTACLNCSFEFIAGLAVFSLLFTFAIAPTASTLGMMFFTVPRGIDAMGAGTLIFGTLFFLLLLLAGLSSSISLLEALCSAVIDKFAWTRRQTLTAAAVVGASGSLCFALPVVIDSELATNGTLGLSILDFVDHWAFYTGLPLVGLIECLIIGWKLPVSKLRQELNRHSRFRIPAVFDWLIKVVIPAGLFIVLGVQAAGEFDGFYGTDYGLDFWPSLSIVCFAVWLVTTLGAATFLTGAESGSESPAFDVPAEASHAS